MFAKSNGNCVEAECPDGRTFVKALRSNPSGNCVEASHPAGLAFTGSQLSSQNGGCVHAAHADGLPFVKATASAANGNCGEAARAGGDVLVRDSKQGDTGPHLHFPASTWQGGNAPVDGFALVPFGVVPSELVEVYASRGGDPDQPWYALTKDGDTLYFTRDEVAAWIDGVLAGEFDLPAQA